VRPDLRDQGQLLWVGRGVPLDQQLVDAASGGRQPVQAVEQRLLDLLLGKLVEPAGAALRLKTDEAGFQSLQPHVPRASSAAIRR
jgi:hypothetical protein